MDARRARLYIQAIINAWKDEPDTGEFIEALKIALDAVEPPLGAGHSEWVYLPDKDLTPYRHMKCVTEIQDWLEKMKDEFDDSPEKIGLLRVTEDNLRVLSMALTVYKAVLMTVNRDEIRERMRKAYSEGKSDE